EQFSTPEDFNNFFSELYKRGIETMLEGEITAQLGYKKSSSRPCKTNYRNGHISKTIKTEQGELKIKVPRDRKSEFEPQVVPKRSRITTGIENPQGLKIH
ncbi:transposase, partial [Lutibacter sp.]